MKYYKAKVSGRQNVVFLTEDTKSSLLNRGEAVDVLEEVDANGMNESEAAAYVAQKDLELQKKKSAKI